MGKNDKWVKIPDAIYSEVKEINDGYKRHH